MKKHYIVLLVSLLFFLSGRDVLGLNYTNFQDLTIHDGKILSEMDEEEITGYYPKINSRKFSGWRVHYINKSKKVTFISETLFSYHNDGKSPIAYNYSFSEQTVSKFSISSSGSISYNLTGEVKKFKNGLNTTLKIDTTTQISSETKESTSMKFDIDPGCRANLYMTGEGKITNGVAARYIFWIRKERGGFEYFELSTVYQRLEIVEI